MPPGSTGWGSAFSSRHSSCVGFALGKRPRLLPYLIVVHFLLDLQAAVSILLVSL